MADRKLVVEIIGDPSSLNAAFGSAAAAATGFGDRLEASSKKVAALGASITKHLTLPIAAVGAVGAKMAVDFQSSMELLHTQAGVSQSAVDSLSKSVLAMAGSVATTPETLATGIYHLASQGLRGAQALDALKVAAEGAKVGGANLEDVTNALGAVLVSGIKGSENYTQAMGELNATVGAGDMHMQDLADAMGTGLPAKAAVFGVSLRDASAALAVFGDNNIRGAEAGTQLNSAIRLMGAPSGAAAKALKGVGISAGELGEDLRSGGLVKAIEDLKGHFSEMGLSATQQAEVLTRAFGGRQAGGVMILMDQLERLKTKEKEVADGGNKFASDWAAYTQTAAYKMDQLGASMSSAGISIGNILLPFVSKAINALSDLAGKFEALPEPVKGFIVVAALTVAAIGPMISVIGDLGTALGFLAANPIVLLVAGVAALVAAVAAAVIWPDKLKSALEDMGLSAHAAGEVVGGLQEVFSLVKTAGEDLVNAVRSHWSEIRQYVGEVVGDVRTVISAFVSVAEALWGEFGSTITTVARNDWNMIKGVVQGAMDVIRGVIDLVTGLIHGDWSQAWNGIKEIVGGVVQGVEAMVSALLGNFEAIFGELAHVMWQGISDGGTKVLDYVKKLPDLVVSALGDLGSLLVDAGEQLMKGLVHGIENEASSVKDAAVNVAKSAYHAVTSFFGIKSPSTMFIEIGQQLMAGLSIGVDTSSKQAVSSLKTALAKAKSALDADRPVVAQAARLLGQKATQGIVDGALGVQQTAAQQLKTALETAMTNALALAKDAPEIQATAAQIGEKATQAVVDGVVGKKETVAQQIRVALQQAVQQAAQGVTTATGNFGSSFDTLANSILSSFSNVTGAFVAPAQKQLDAMQLQDQVKQYSDAVKQAAATVQADQQALTQAQAGGDPAAIQAAQAQLLTDQQAHDAAVRQQQEFQIGQLAKKQTAAYDKQRGDQENALAKQLEDLKKSLAKNPKEWDTMGKQVEAVIKKYGVPMYASGQKFASDFASGIKSQISAAEDAAKALAEAVAKYIPRSPAQTGPLAFSSLAAGQKFGAEFSAGINQGLYAGQGLSTIAGSFQTAITTATLGAGAGIGAAGGVTVNVTVPVQGSLVGATPQEIADELKYPIRDALLTIGRSEPTIFKGLA